MNQEIRKSGMPVSDVSSVWSFKDAEGYLNDTAPPGKSIYGLGRIRHLLDLLGHPENDIICVTVVGTNGKGSVLAFLDSLIRAHGPRVVCHIKPHLESVTERIRIDGLDSTQNEFASALFEVKAAVDLGWSRDDRPTYFELIFAAFLCAARSAGVDIVLLEAGLGGRLDAVNAVDASMVILTSVDYDHTELLGNSLEEITGEKIVVARPGSTLVCQTNPDEVKDIVRQYTSREDIRLIEITDGSHLAPGKGGSYSYNSRSMGKLANIQPSLDGPYQHMNAGLSLTALETLADIQPSLFPDGLQEEAIRDGMKKARLPGRWERIQQNCNGSKVITWILDGAHNPSGVRGVLAQFKKDTSGIGTILFGMKKSKNVGDIIPYLLDSCGRVIFVPVPGLDSHDPECLAGVAARALDNSTEFSQIHIDSVDSIYEGMKNALETTPATASILVTGSLYLAGAVRTELMKHGSILMGVSSV